MLVCYKHAHDWTLASFVATEAVDEAVEDSVSTVLEDGDTVTVIKDRKITGSCTVPTVVIKVGDRRLMQRDETIDRYNDGTK